MGYQHGRQVRSVRQQIVAVMEARFAQLEQDGADAAFAALVEETPQVVETVDPLWLFGHGQVMELGVGSLQLFEQLLVGAASQFGLAGVVADHPGQKKERSIE
ncbi:MAG: hypothetical protein BroJett011_67830 [Chloroflexota bacterium]|nr:MAG: hypothetical protein BroJett011_67830 [Chloroflexota bacterium]